MSTLWPQSSKALTHIHWHQWNRASAWVKHVLKCLSGSPHFAGSSPMWLDQDHTEPGVKSSFQKTVLHALTISSCYLPVCVLIRFVCVTHRMWGNLGGVWSQGGHACIFFLAYTNNTSRKKLHMSPLCSTMLYPPQFLSQMICLQSVLHAVNMSLLWGRTSSIRNTFACWGSNRSFVLASLLF